jgi:hypothetical protein
MLLGKTNNTFRVCLNRVVAVNKLCVGIVDYGLLWLNIKQDSASADEWLKVDIVFFRDVLTNFWEKLPLAASPFEERLY